MSAAMDLLADLRNTPGIAVTPTVSTAVKAVAWARVSTDMQDERGLSIPEQQREIREYAKQHDMEIVAEFHEATSAFQKDEKRVEFHRMLTYARSRRDISVILVHDYSRFSRDSARAKLLLRELRQANIRVVSLNDLEADPETVAGVYLEAITLAKNEAYSREVAFHTIKGCRANVQQRDPETGWCYKNGGQPLFGYKSRQLIRGEERRGKPIIKSIWELDDTIVNGRPMHEWARECLLMVAEGASLDTLRDFCNENGIPGRRKAYWGISTWNALLQPAVLLKYAGHEVWNVHRKNGSERPQEEWTIVENAHPAILTADEVKVIIAIRRKRQQKAFDQGYSRSKRSSYLLSGGIFKCQRCGSNMTGLRTSSGVYYVCGSRPYRRGLGCGPGVYVPQEWIESRITTSIQEVMAYCGDEDGLTREVNDELRLAWETRSGYDPTLVRKQEEIARKIANIQQSIENGCPDVAWANQRWQALLQEQARLAQVAQPTGEAPQINASKVLAYQRQMEKLLAQGTAEDKKQLLRDWVSEIKLTPEDLSIGASLQVPESVMHSLVAGAGFEPATFGL